MVGVKGTSEALNLDQNKAYGIKLIEIETQCLIASLKAQEVSNSQSYIKSC